MIQNVLLSGRYFGVPQNLDEQLGNLEAVLMKLKLKGIKLNDSKCNFFQQKIKYIEHTILKDRYQAYPDDAVALENFRKPPKTVGELRSRLGFFGYYRGYVKNFSIILKSLNNVLKGESNSQEIKTLTKKKRNSNKNICS